MQDDKIIAAVRQWVNAVVVGMNLCPFAPDELAKNRVRFTLTAARTEDELLAALQTELELLGTNTSIETTLLIHPQVLQDFHDYIQFLEIADALLVQLNLEGIYQVASFHPDYRFSGTEPDAAENYTNRSPYPMLHVLREDSLARAIDGHPNVGQIPLQNIERMNAIGRTKLQAILHDCIPGKRVVRDT
jgi:hypothetical protein